MAAVQGLHDEVTRLKDLHIEKDVALEKLAKLEQKLENHENAHKSEKAGLLATIEELERRLEYLEAITRKDGKIHNRFVGNSRNRF